MAEQAAVEGQVRELLGRAAGADTARDAAAGLSAAGRGRRVRARALRLHAGAHRAYAREGLGTLSRWMVSLDSSRAWILFWNVHSLALLGEELPEERAGPAPPSAGGEGVEELREATSKADCLAFLAACQDAGGGFGGGPGHLPHLATSYAAVASLVTLGGEAALGCVDRGKMLGFLRRMQVRDESEQRGGFAVHEGGEVDTRGCYTAMAIARMLRLDLGQLDVAAMAGFLRRCQTYEGGLGGEPWNEAHGGYTYCGVAALALAGRLGDLDLRRLLRWGLARQGAVEGGFNGRTNKLVDGCYSFWQGGMLCILQEHAADLFRQFPRDVPRKPFRAGGEGGAEGGGAAGGGGPPGAADPRLLSSAHFLFPPEGDAARVASRGLAWPLFNASALQAWILLCSQGPRGGLRDKPGKAQDHYHTCYCLSGLAAAQMYSGTVLGPGGNALREIDILLNVRADRAEAFAKLLRRGRVA